MMLVKGRRSLCAGTAARACGCNGQKAGLPDDLPIEDVDWTGDVTLGGFGDHGEFAARRASLGR